MIEGSWHMTSYETLPPVPSNERLILKDAEDDEDEEPGSFKKLAQSKLRWGVVRMPPEWYEEYGQLGPVEHLSFGVEEDNPSDPVPGHLYA
jgi:hypothetical protein